MTNNTPSSPEDSPVTLSTGDPERFTLNTACAPSTSIIEAIAESTGHDPTAIPSLQHSLDVDALDALLAGTESTASNVRISFTFEDIRVTVDGDTVELRDRY
jgi:hypothetical protein